MKVEKNWEQEIFDRLLLFNKMKQSGIVNIVRILASLKNEGHW